MIAKRSDEWLAGEQDGYEGNLARSRDEEYLDGHASGVAGREARERIKIQAGARDYTQTRFTPSEPRLHRLCQRNH